MLETSRNTSGRRGWAGAIGLLAVLVCGWMQAADKTSVILITIDTLRADRVGAYGYTRARTPVMDRLAREGVLFENAIVQTPFTLPSHASIMTSTYPMFHGLQDVIGQLRQDVPTLAEWFLGQGYATGAFVGSSVLLEQWGLDRGFQFYEDSFSADLSSQTDFDRVERPAEEVVQLATDWIAKAGSKPFFAWIHLYDPHDPYQPPEPFATEFRDRPYDGEIAYTDAMLGKLFGNLEESGQYESTLIVLTADHGEMLGEHGEAFHAFFIYQPALHVPLILRLPAGRLNGLGPGLRVRDQVRSVDILPTVVQLLGHPVPAWVQGESLLPWMAGKQGDRVLPAYAETHYPRVHFSWSPLFSYSDGSYKYIDAPMPELYDLKSDPGELENLFTRQERLAAGMKEQLYELQKRYVAGVDGTGGNQPEVDSRTIARLQALGYVAFSAGSSAEAGLDLPDPKLKIQSYNILNRGIALSRGGKRQEAIALFRDLAAREPEMPIVHFLLGMEFFGSADYLLAAEQFQQTLERNPDSNVARFNLARSFARGGLSGRAREVLRQLLHLEPTHLAARHMLASLFSAERRFEEAIEEERKAIELSPQFAEGHNNLGSYYLSLGRVEEAIDSYRKATEYAPANWLAHENLTLAYLTQKNFDLALKEADIVLRLNPRSSLAHFYAGQAYLGKGMRQEAATAFQRAKALDPTLNVPQF